MSDPVTTLLDAITAGEPVPPGVLADNARLDATVPGWRFTLGSGEAIRAQFARWFADTGHFDELERTPLPGGELVRFLLCWTEKGVPHAAHQTHILGLESGRIVSDTMFCGGRWDAGLLAKMEEKAAHAGA
jgi:hypothetical protein